VIAAQGPRGDNLQKYIKEFTELTGIQVESNNPEATAAPEGRDRARLGTPSFDVVNVSYHVQKRQFEKAGWLADISAT